MGFCLAFKGLIQPGYSFQTWCRGLLPCCSTLHHPVPKCLVNRHGLLGVLLKVRTINALCGNHVDAEPLRQVASATDILDGFSRSSVGWTLKQRKE
jgi:hypothetical protein